MEKLNSMSLLETYDEKKNGTYDEDQWKYWKQFLMKVITFILKDRMSTSGLSSYWL